MNGRRRTATVLLVLLTSCSRKDQGASEDASASGANSAVVTAPDAGAMLPEPPRERTPKDLLDEHRRTLSALADQGKYAEVCKGAPWFNQVICAWVAARADGKAVGRPDGELFRAFFYKEHWKHAYGRIIGDPTAPGDLEVSVNGYRNHCILELTDTKYSSKGNFNLWVQEQPETREVTLNSGASANWVVLEEASLAKALMDLAHSGGGIEGTAMAKDAMKMIAEYQTYAELKGELPSVPGAAPSGASPDAGAAPSASSASPATASPLATTLAAVTVKTAAAAPPPPVMPPKNPRARAECLSACVSKCADDAACERACAGKCPSS